MGCQLLRDSDATSMAHSLELRVPFVDLEVVGFSRSCADEYKLSPDGGESSQYQASGAKRVLIHALKDVLPPTIAGRPKRGFALPFRDWMRGAVRPLVEDTCSRNSLLRRGLVDPDLVPPPVVEGNGAAANLYPDYWTLMILEMWCRGVLDAGARVPQPAIAAPASH
jgi:asparagine synthase (glutamine-hydrolysing)